MIKLVCFDLDGVLVDAVEWHYESLNRALQEVSGFVLSREEHLVTYNGLPTKKKLETLTAEGRVKSEDAAKIWNLKQAYTKDCIQEFGRPDEVKIDMHEKLWALGITVVCVTNSITETANLMLEVTGQRKYMDKLIANDMITNPKPHPEGYITAMSHYSMMPKETLIVEDSPKGLQAAYATGAHVFQVEGCADVTFLNLFEYLGIQ